HRPGRRDGLLLDRTVRGLPGGLFDWLLDGHGEPHGLILGTLLGSGGGTGAPRTMVLGPPPPAPALTSAAVRSGISPGPGRPGPPGGCRRSPPSVACRPGQPAAPSAPPACAAPAAPAPPRR